MESVDEVEAFYDASRARVTRLLLDHQADVHRRDGTGWTALHYAVCAGGAAVLMLALGGLLTLVPRRCNPPFWTNYLKFDRNLGAAVGFYYERHPSRDPELVRIRERILASRDETVGRDLRQWRMQELSQGAPGPRRWVFFIVVDALRVRMAGTVTTAVEVSGTLTEPAAASSLTSGATLRLMRSPTIVGVKARLTPICL